MPDGARRLNHRFPAILQSISTSVHPVHTTTALLNYQEASPGRMKEIISQELPTAKQSSTGGPKPPTEGVHHPLLVHRPHPNGLIEQYVESRTATGGNAQREKLIWDLYAASQIHREPPVGQPSTSSRLHLDMLLGKDDFIELADYLKAGQQK